jgi:hypothetical protein
MEVVGGWRRLHNEELHNVYASPKIRVIKSRRMRSAGHVACTRALRSAYKIRVKKPERDHTEDLRVDGKIILERILGKKGVKVWTGFIWLKSETSGRIL